MPTMFRQNNNAGLGELANALVQYPVMRDQYRMQAQGMADQRKLRQAQLQGQMNINNNYQPMADAKLQSQQLTNEGLTATNLAQTNLNTAREDLSGTHGPVAHLATSMNDFYQGLGNQQSQGFLNQAAQAGDPARMRAYANLGGRSMDNRFDVKDGTKFDTMSGASMPTQVGIGDIMNNVNGGGAGSGASPFMKVQNPMGMGALYLNKQTLAPVATVGMDGQITQLPGSPSYQPQAEPAAPAAPARDNTSLMDLITSMFTGNEAQAQPQAQPQGLAPAGLMPPGGAEQTMMEAQQAVANGAPLDAVNARLQQAGLPPISLPNGL